MNDLLTFDFDRRPVRIVIFDDAPWWVATDLASILGYGSAKDLCRNLDDDEKGRHNVPTPGGEQEHTIISESGLYNAIFRSRRDEARAFRRWVTGEVLPALRRHGRYQLPGLDLASAAPAPLDPARLNSSIATVQEARKLFGPASARLIWVKLGLPTPLEQVAPGIALDPLVPDLEAFCATVGECTVDEAAAALGLDGTDRTTRLRLGRLLRELGWLPRRARRKGYSDPVTLFTPMAAAVREAV